MDVEKRNMTLPEEDLGNFWFCKEMGNIGTRMDMERFRDIYANVIAGIQYMY